MPDLRGAARPAFLRLDPPELQGTTLVVRAVSGTDRARRRQDRSSPFGYLYERQDDDGPAADLTLTAGHYDETALVWSFSGDVLGIAGISEPHPSPGATETPGHRKEQP